VPDRRAPVRARHRAGAHVREEGPFGRSGARGDRALDAGKGDRITTRERDRSPLARRAVAREALATAADVRPQKPTPRSATLSVTSRVGLVDSAGNTQSLNRASDAIRPCLRGAPLPLEIALVILQDGTVKVGLTKDVANVQTCAQTAVANIRFELEGSTGLIRLRAGP